VDKINLVFSENLGLVILIVAATAVVGLVITVINASRLRSITGPFAWLSGGSGEKSDSLPMLLKSVENLGRDVEHLKSDVEGIILENKRHFKKIGLVRYDAFDGVAGHQSYSLCLLDDNKNGVLISSLVGRNFARSYAIKIAAGEASRELGDEEAGALKEALDEGSGFH
jgi:hypothetical protein